MRLVILMQGFHTDTPTGKLALTMFAAFAEFEHGIRKERQREGIVRARLEGEISRPKAEANAGATNPVEAALCCCREPQRTCVRIRHRSRNGP